MRLGTESHQQRMVELYLQFDNQMAYTSEPSEGSQVRPSMDEVSQVQGSLILELECSRFAKIFFSLNDPFELSHGCC